LAVRDGGNQFARQTLILIGAAAKKDLVALFAGNLCAQQTDIANVVLRA
jgi:hypothetical protein